ASYDLTVPNDLPGTTSLLEMTSTGQIQYSASILPGTPPTKQIFTTAGAGTYTRPTPAPAYIKVKMVGGGGGGGGCGTGSPADGSLGSATVFDIFTVLAGSGGDRAVGTGAGGEGGLGGASTFSGSFAGGP